MCREGNRPQHPTEQGSNNSGRKGGGKGAVNGKTHAEKELQDKVRALEKERDDLRLRAEAAEQEGGGPEAADEEMEDEEQASVKADIAKIAELQKLYDSAAALGSSDPLALQLKCRLDKAKAAQRATKPLLAQIQAAERRSEKLEQSIKNTEKAKADLEKEREELTGKIAAEQKRLDDLRSEADKLRGELSGLHERARDEKGGGPPAPPEAESKPPVHDIGAAIGLLRAWTQAWATSGAVEPQVAGAAGRANGLLAQFETLLSSGGHQLQQAWQQQQLQQQPTPPPPVPPPAPAAPAQDQNGDQRAEDQRAHLARRQREQTLAIQQFEADYRAQQQAAKAAAAAAAAATEAASTAAATATNEPENVDSEAESGIGDELTDGESEIAGMGLDRTEGETEQDRNARIAKLLAEKRRARAAEAKRRKGGRKGGKASGSSAVPNSKNK